jgi:hypothetical protein
MARVPRILLSEGSSLSAREAITAFGLAGHRVHLVTSEPFCLGRFSRFVERVHRAPASGANPAGYLEAVLGTVAHRRADSHPRAGISIRRRPESDALKLGCGAG